MQKKIIIILFTIFSCGYLPSSLGEYNEVLIFSSEKDNLLIKPHIDDLFNKFINTPQIEQSFDLKYLNTIEFKKYKKNKFIILASLQNPSDSTGDILVSRFVDKFKKDDLMLLEDLYAKDQLIFILKGLDAIDIQNKIRTHRSWILNEFNNFKSNLLQNEVYRNGKNYDLSKKIMDRFNFSIDLQIDYKEIKFDTLNSFIWVGRGIPYRWIIMQKDNKKFYKNIENTWKRFDVLINNNIPEITISKYYKKNYEIIHEKRKVNVIRGLYEHEETQTGGPFVTYLFEQKGNDDLILITGFVNNPANKKLKLLEELEIIIKTIQLGV